VCLIGILMVCADAQAQPGGGRGQGRGGGGFGRGGFGFGGGGTLGFVQRDDVRTELKLTDAQQEELEALSDELRQQGGRGRGGFEGFAEMSDEERAEAFARIQADAQKQQEEARAKVKEVLNAEQNKRLGELEIQFAMQQLRTNPQLQVLAAYVDNAKLEAAMGEPFEFQTGFGGGRGFGGQGRGGRGGDDADRGRGRRDRDNANEANEDDDDSAGGRRRRDR
jgi:hypothetical protein